MYDKRRLEKGDWCMNKKRVLYEAREYRDIRELVEDTVSRFPENIAFIVQKYYLQNVTRGY